MIGILYLVSTPIGDPDDITMRAVRVLSEVAAVICEEARIGSTLLSRLKIVKPLIELNEHTEASVVPLLIERLARGENLALVSDHGTPLIADPGAPIVGLALLAGFRVVPVPGPSSPIAALVSSGFALNRFRFLGQLPPKAERRRRVLRQIKNLAETLVILDAPYRLMPLLRSLREELGGLRQIVVACNLTMPGERLTRGTISEVLESFEREPFRGEFVTIIEGAKMEGHPGSGNAIKRR